MYGSRTQNSFLHDIFLDRASFSFMMSRESIEKDGTMTPDPEDMDHQDQQDDVDVDIDIDPNVEVSLRLYFLLASGVLVGHLVCSAASL